jgi:hypothetical protein
MGGACCMNGGNKYYIQDFRQEISKEGMTFGFQE